MYFPVAVYLSSWTITFSIVLPSFPYFTNRLSIPELANLSDEQIKVLKKTLAKDHGISTDPLADGTSRESVFSEITGGVTDVLNMAAGNYQGATQDGFVDADGKFHQRTCFVAGTLVHTIDGLKNIEDITIGDVVSSKSDITGEVAFKKVKSTFIRQTEAIYKVSFADGTILETTWNHPFRRQKVSQKGDQFTIENSEWTEAKDLVPGDVTYSANGNLLVVDSVTVDHREETVYNFEVEDFHTYFVGEAGVWVHNENYGIGQNTLQPNNSDAFRSEGFLRDTADKVKNWYKGYGFVTKDVLAVKKIVYQSEADIKSWNDSGILSKEDIDSIGSKFGSRKLYNKDTKKYEDNFHFGVDIRKNEDDAITTRKPGKVIFIDNNEDSFYGKRIQIDHGSGTQHSHMKEILVKKDQIVGENQEVGKVGQTGTSALGVHDHFMVFKNGKPIDPLGAEWKR